VEELALLDLGAVRPVDDVVATSVKVVGTVDAGVAGARIERQISS
jgi:hypothetical protein